jgi:hypothetical protein
MRYRLVVVCDSVADAICAAGGWLFDRGLAGCEATVLVTDHTDDRALRIVGADAIELHTPLASEVLSARPDTLVVTADLLRRDLRVRQGVLEALDEGLTKVMTCGDSWPAEFEALGTQVQHRLSIAARAFKTAALAALGASSDLLGLVEPFRGIDLRARRSEAASRTATDEPPTHWRTA